MKPILITLLALPIVGSFHNYSQLPQAKARVIVAKAQNNTEAKKAPSKVIVAPKAVIAPIVAPAPPAPAPAPVPTPIVYAKGCSNYEPTFAEYGWNINVAMAICQAESSGNPRAVSATNDYGLMQIHDGLQIYGTKIYDPYFNISVAYHAKFLTQGWEAWSSFNSGIYKEYL